MITFLEFSKTALLSEQTVISAAGSYIFTAVISSVISKYAENQDEILKSKAKYDYLTGIFNRRAFLDNLYREYDFIKRNQKIPISILILDIDHFKSYNDRFGQEAGDHLLIEIKDIILNHLRTTDIFARWGSEEFIIAAIDTNLKHAELLAEKLRKLIESFQFSTAGNITVSIGISEFIQNDHIDSLIKRSEAALKAAKNKGRNQTASSNDS